MAYAGDDGQALLALCVSSLVRLEVVILIRHKLVAEVGTEFEERSWRES